MSDFANEPKTVRVDVWSDVVCPFCYVGEKRFERVAREEGYAIEWVWHSFELEPDAPSTHATPNIDLIAGKYDTDRQGAEQHQRNVAALCASENIDFAWEKVMPGNTRNAHRIIAAAQGKGLGTAAADAFFEAYMNEGQRIGERDVVREIARKIGLSDDEIETALSSDEIEEQILADRQAAGHLGITGVPFFIVDNKVALSGAQPQHVFKQALDRIRPMQIERVADDSAMVCDAEGCRVPGA